MSETRDQFNISSIGIQRIMPTTGASRRLTKRQPENDRDTDDDPIEPDASPAPPTPGTGKLIDKAV
jgi:hypothetical protein